MSAGTKPSRQELVVVSLLSGVLTAIGIAVLADSAGQKHAPVFEILIGCGAILAALAIILPEYIDWLKRRKVTS